MEAAASPLPSEDTTPPVTKMYFADIRSSFVGIYATVGWAHSSPIFGEPCPLFWQRDQGGACRGARSIMDGILVDGKTELLELCQLPMTFIPRESR